MLLRRAAIGPPSSIAAVICSLDVITAHVLSIDGILYLLPFFFLGLYFGRFGDPLAIPGGVPIAWLLVAVGAVATQAGLLGLLDHLPAHRADRAPVRCRLLHALDAHRLAKQRARAHRHVLVRHLSLPHVRRGRPAEVLPEIGIRSPYLMFAPMLAAGLLLPILVELVASRYTLTRALLLGQKPLRTSGAAPSAPPVFDGRLREPGR